MKRVTGIGGIFFKADNAEKLYNWYEKYLGIKRAPDGSGAMFEWREADDSQRKGMTIWAVFRRDTKYFDPSRSGFMINYRVDDLDALLETLRKEGVEIDPYRENYDYGALPGSWTQRGTALNFGNRPSKPPI